MDEKLNSAKFDLEYSDDEFEVSQGKKAKVGLISANLRYVLISAAIGLVLLGVGLLVIDKIQGSPMSKYQITCDGLFGQNNSDVVCENGDKDCKCAPRDCAASSGSVSVQECFMILNKGG